jgi:hypothetical protein
MSSGERSNTGDQHVSALTERESFNGWVFDVVVGEGDLERHVDVVLSWVDYEYWSHGTASPSVVAEQVVRSVLDADPKRELPEKFDCSTARRWVRDLDRRVRELL